MKKIICFSLLSLLLVSCTSVLRIAESEETIANWNYGKQFQSQGKFEMARQYYLLALTAAQTQEVMDKIERDLYTVDLQIKTMR